MPRPIINGIRPTAQRERRMLPPGPSIVEATASNNRPRKTIKPKPTLLVITPALISSRRFTSGVFFLRASFLALRSSSQNGFQSSPLLTLPPPLLSTPFTRRRLTPHLVQYFV